MNDERSFERFVADNVAGTTSGIPLPDDFYDDIHAYASRTRQRPEWLAIIKEPPMRSNSRLAVGSPTFRVAAIMVATLLLALLVAGAGIAGQRLLAADDALVVAADGSGDFVTIPEALAAAQDGTTLTIRPGEYPEPFVVDKDVRLVGDGRREEIVLGGHEAPSLQSGCESDLEACAFVLDQVEASVSGVTFRGEHAGLGIIGGAPTVEGVLFDAGTEPPSSGSATFGVQVSIDGSSNARVLDNEFLGESEVAIMGKSNPLLEGNVMHAWMINGQEPGNDTIIRGNDFSGSGGDAISVLSASTLLIEENALSDAGGDGISVGFMSISGVDPIIRRNTITGSGGNAIFLAPGAAPTIEGNTLLDNRYGVFLQSGDAVVRGNDIRGEGVGIAAAGGGTPSIAENNIDVTGRGISLTRGSGATLSGNTVCGGDVSIFVDEDSEPVIDESNELCEVAVTG